LAIVCVVLTHSRAWRPSAMASRVIISLIIDGNGIAIALTGRWTGSIGFLRDAESVRDYKNPLYFANMKNLASAD
jgi:hypothetical protein